MVVQTKDPIASVIETSARGDTALAIIATDQTTPALDLRFLEELNVTTIAADTAVEDTSFTATVSHGIVVGNIIEIAEGSVFIQAEVLSVATDLIGIDTPINHAYLSGAVLIVSNKNMNVVGTISSPRIFSITPGPGQKGDITRVIISIQDSTAMDFSTFGGIASGVLNGCVIRMKKENGDFTNLFNWKTNGDFIITAFDHVFQSKIGGGLHSFVCRSTWAGQSKRGVTLRVDNTLGEEIQVLVQDDLSSLSLMGMAAQGHELQS